MKRGAERQIREEKKRFQAHLHRKKRQMSQVRSRIFELVMATHGHFAAEEIVKLCRSKRIAASRASVYRCLKEMLEAGVIRETAYGQKHHLFEHLYDEEKHHHARCLRCQAIVEFPDLNEDKIYRPILKKKGFLVLGHEMHFYGLCRQCLQEEGEESV